MSWLSIAAPIVGGLLGAQSSKQGTSTTSEQKLDPRMDRYVYGADGQSGLMGSAFDLAQQQLKTGGLNDLQRQGMDMQRQYLMSPQYQQGFGNMASLGQQLMGGGVASNPFTKGGGPAGNPFAAQQPFSYSGPMNAQLPNFQAQPAMMTPENTKAINGLLSGGVTGGNRGGNGTSGTSFGGIGTGNMTDAIQAQMKDTFQSYLAMGLTPAVAMSLVQSAMATNGVLGAVNEAADPIGALNAIQGWTTPDTSYDPYGGVSDGGYSRGFGGGDNGVGNSGTGGGSNVGSRGNGGSGD